MMIKKVLYFGLGIELILLGKKVYDSIQLIPSDIFNSTKLLAFGCVVAISITPIIDAITKVKQTKNTNSNGLKESIRRFKNNG